MLNVARGDAPIMLDGMQRRLRLTFGALAEIEAGLQVCSMAELGARLSRLSAGDMRIVLQALLRGAGEFEAALHLDRTRVDLAAAADAIAQAFREGAG